MKINFLLLPWGRWLPKILGETFYHGCLTMGSLKIVSIVHNSSTRKLEHNSLLSLSPTPWLLSIISLVLAPIQPIQLMTRTLLVAPTPWNLFSSCSHYCFLKRVNFNTFLTMMLFFQVASRTTTWLNSSMSSILDIELNARYAKKCFFSLLLLFKLHSSMNPYQFTINSSSDGSWDFLFSIDQCYPLMVLNTMTMCCELQATSKQKYYPQDHDHLLLQYEV